MRQIKVHSPTIDVVGPPASYVSGQFLTTEFQQYTTIRWILFDENEIIVIKDLFLQLS